MEEALEKIHKASIQLLETVGFRVGNQEILQVLSANGVRIEGTTVYFTEQQIMDAVHMAPKSFTLRARNPQKDVTIGDGPTKFGAGYGCTFVADNQGRRRDATMEDYIRFAKLVHHSGLFGVNGGILVQPAELDAAVCYPMMLFATMALSDMALLGFSSHAQDVRHCMALGEIAFGGHEAFVSDYHILTLVNILTPLQLGDFGEETLLVAAQYKQPVILTPGISGGSTAPITPGGVTVLGNAEVLATVAIAQMLCPGLPVIHGINGSVMDMQTGATRTSNPLNEQVRSMARKLAQMYQLPCRNAGGLTDAKVPGLQSNFEAQMALGNAMREGTSIALHAAGILDSFMSMSYEKFMMDCEIIRTLSLAWAPMDCSENGLAVDAITQAGIGGNYMASPHTFANYRNFSFAPAFSAAHQVLHEDPAQANNNYMDRATSQVETWLDAYERPIWDEEICQKCTQYLMDILGVSPQQIAQILQATSKNLG